LREQVLGDDVKAAEGDLDEEKPEMDLEERVFPAG
jgi:hypothetical protein